MDHNNNELHILGPKLFFPRPSYQISKLMCDKKKLTAKLNSRD
jgi:hypothetical protein